MERSGDRYVRQKDNEKNWGKRRVGVWGGVK